MARDASGHRGEPDRGESTAEVVILVPVAMLILVLGVHATAWYHAAHVAKVAAAEGAAAASALDGSRAAGLAEATQLLADLGSAPSSYDVALDEPHDATVGVTVALRVPRLTPFLRSAVQRRVVSPLERPGSEYGGG